MPISNKLFVRSTIALLTIALFALLAIVGSVIWLGERSQVYFNNVLEARDARAAASDLRNSLRVIETSQRGFLITTNEDYLVSFNRAQEVLPQRLETLKGALARFPESDVDVADLEATIIEKISEIDRTVELARSGKVDEAIEIVRTDRGKQLMDNAVSFLTRVIADADAGITEGTTEQRRNADWLRLVSVLGGVLIIAVVGGSAVTVWRYTRELSQARDEVAVLNADLEQRVQNRTAELKQANEEIQRFAYIVTHDLRAPLVNIMGFTSELEESVKSVQALLQKEVTSDSDKVLEEARIAADEDLPEAIGFIRSSTTKMDGLINAILKLSRAGRRALRAERVELRSFFDAAVASVQHQLIDANGRVDLSISAPPISSDRLSLEQIFGNLIDNAVKYRAPGRPLRVDVRAATAPGNQVTIEIADNGRGISDQDKERVFELFRRSGVQDQPGEGIGLAYVRTLVRNLGGDITMKSVLGEGTTFTVTLPRTLKTVGSTAA